MGVEVWRQVAAGAGNGDEREPADLLAFAVQGAHLGGRERSGRALGMDGGAPEHLVGHPVADARKTFLHQQDGLDRGAAAAF